MTTALAAFVLAAALGAFPATAPPRCIADLTAGESGAHPRVAAPAVMPSHGDVGARVGIAGTGFAPGTHLIMAAVYGEDGCRIDGLGDQYLGATLADARGAYSAAVSWPRISDPVLGRERTTPRPLPHGRYYVFALPCDIRPACSFTEGTQPGGPFVFGGARGSPAAVWSVALAIVVVAAGTIVVRRRR
jgi:hypothetical protein